MAVVSMRFAFGFGWDWAIMSLLRLRSDAESDSRSLAHERATEKARGRRRRRGLPPDLRRVSVTVDRCRVRIRRGNALGHDDRPGVDDELAHLRDVERGRPH